MSSARKFLTKSKFAKSWECPRKLYYATNKEYGSNDIDDPFLKALARGGFQVGALAQRYFQGGTIVSTLDPDRALAQTKELLANERIIIFEGAFQHENLLIRADIIEKQGKFINLIEVKAKSFRSDEEFPIWNKTALKKSRYQLKAEFKDKIVDLAFQTYVLRKAHPELTVRSFLMLADKSQFATVDGLNQVFKIVKNANGREAVEIKAADETKDLGDKVLGMVELTDEIKKVFNEVAFDGGLTFPALVRSLSEQLARNEKGEAKYSSACRDCEFRVKEAPGVKSGFQQCHDERGITAAQIAKKPLVLELWNHRGINKLLEDGCAHLDQLDEEILKVKPRDWESGLSQSERQMLQVNYARGVCKEPFYFDAAGIKAEIEGLVYPLHFIDFETSMVAIPFHKGRRPYEQMAFQFSHHVLHANRRVEKREDYLDDRVGVFPNFDFVRALKKALSGDDGAVLRYAGHENTVLNQIREQLLESAEPDRDELVAWIESLTSPPERLEGDWVPSRQFVDVLDLILRFVYLPACGRSNSIKIVLPAVLSLAGWELRKKFPQWVQPDGLGGFVDPYSLLPPLFSDVSPEEMEKVQYLFTEDESLKDGGAAMMAWARMQFSEMSSAERSGLTAALKRYCALDTLAMVLVWEWMVGQCQRQSS